MSKCPYCNHDIEDDADICPNCNESLKIQCPYCKEYISVNDKICPKCSTRLTKNYLFLLELATYLLLALYVLGSAIFCLTLIKYPDFWHRVFQKEDNVDGLYSLLLQSAVFFSVPSLIGIIVNRKRKFFITVIVIFIVLYLINVILMNVLV